MSSPRQPTDLVAPVGAPTRWTSRPLPVYRHVPGLTPHPINHPDGHSYGTPAAADDPLDLDIERHWRRCEPYLYGVDLFNRAYFWEAHEAWEEVWHAVGHRTLSGRMVQGMIQVAAALLQRHRGMERGAERNFAKARAHFEAVAENKKPGVGPIYLGVDLPSWITAVTEFLTNDAAPFPFLYLGED